MKKCPKCGYQEPKLLYISIIGDGSAGQRHARMLRERGHVCTVFGINDSPLENRFTDAVVIATPPESHEQYLRYYWNRCPILCEGPVTWHHMKPVNEVYPHMTASNWLFVPQIQSLKTKMYLGEKITNWSSSCLNKTAIQKPVSAHLWFDYDLAKWRGEGWDYKNSCYYESGIDLINCHEAMTALWLFGLAEQVERIAIKTGKSKGLDAVSLVVKHKSGCLTTISSGWHSAKYQRGIRIVFEDGSCEEIGWTSPQDDAICNQSYSDMIDHWLKAIAENDVDVRPSLLDGYRAYKLMQGEAC